MLSFLFIVLQLCVSNGHGHGHVHHECAHNKLSKEVEVIEMPQNYDNHPYDQSHRRLTDSSTTTNNIRIRPYYTMTSSDGLAANQITYIKQLLSTSISYFEQYVQVIPVSDNLKFDRQCKQFYTTPFGRNCIEYYDNTCGPSSVPDAHLASSLLYDYDNKRVSLMKGGGGVKDTDLLLYVSYQMTSTCSSGSTLAHANACYHDQYGRPIAGSVNICPLMFDSSGSGTNQWKKDVITVLHEMTHVLVFSDALFHKFRDSTTGNVIAYENVVAMSGDISFLITPNVKAFTRSFFGCSSSMGLALENDGGSGSAGSHFEMRVLNTDYMTSTISSSQTYISKAILYLMLDSGWYYMDASLRSVFGDEFYFGKDAGCSFLNDKCVSNGVSNFPQLFCDGNEFANGCLYNNRAISNCPIYSYSQSLPAQYQYFSDASRGGDQTSAFCPISRTFSYSNIGAPDDFDGECVDERGNQYKSGSYQSWSLSSRCVHALNGQSQTGLCYQHKCNGYDAANKQWGSVTIKVSSNEIVCNRNDKYQQKSVDGFVGFNIYCPDVDAVCGSTTKPFACKYGEYDDAMNKCRCNLGYKGTACDVVDDDSFVAEAVTVTTDGDSSNGYPDGMIGEEPSSSDKKHVLCIEGMHAAMDGQYVYQRMYNYQPVYFRMNGAGQSLYVYWDLFDKQWYIADMVPSDGSFYAKCQTDTEWNDDLSSCSKQWSFSAVAESYYCGDSDGAAAIYDESGDENDDGESNDKSNGNDFVYLFGGIVAGALCVAIIFGCVFYFHWKNKNMNVHDIDMTHISKDLILEDSYAPL